MPTEDKHLNTFWKLVNIHRIEIPIIQRDYAQGRTDLKATQIRQGFVYALINCLDIQEPLHLDFIYGKIGGKTDLVKVENNKRAIANLLRSVQSYSDNLDISFTYEIDNRLSNDNEVFTSFIPLDGQQRLTTLFLLHWYLAAQLNITVENILCNFTYMTRRTSKDFCKALVYHAFKAAPNDLLSLQIKDLSWFFQNWIKDPTVKSMLTVLDEIHHNLKGRSDDDLLIMWKGLTQTDKVTFEFLDLEKFELTDELYVKMNARGKHLTDFENFKAWLQDYVKENGTELTIADWHKKMDIKWTDIFWNFKDKGIYEIDREYLSFFNLISLFFFTEKVKIENNKIEDEEKEIIDTFRNSGFIAQSIYEKYKCFDTVNLNNILSILRIFQDGGYVEFENIIQPLFNLTDKQITQKLFGSDNSKLNLPDSTYLYALVRFLNIKDKSLNNYDEIDRGQLQNWMRVCRNLIYNVYIFNPETFVNAIKSIQKLSANCLNIYEYLIRRDIDISFFTTVQKDEEVLKAKLIAANPEWEALFINFEKHSYFNGQIGFILETSKNEEYVLDEFVINAQKSANIFNEIILNSPSFWFQRAFFSLKNYFLQIGSNQSFCLNNDALRDKEENWRRVLRDKEKLNAYQRLLSLIELGKEMDGFKSIVKDYKTDSWKTYFVKSPEPFKCCDKKMIRFHNENDILLLKTSRIYGNHAELRTYSFYCKNVKDNLQDFEPFEIEEYWYNPKNDYHPCIVLNNFKFKSKSYQINIYYLADGQTFEIVFLPNNGKISNEIIITALGTVGFNLIENSWCCYANSEKKLQSKLNEISTTLNKL